MIVDAVADAPTGSGSASGSEDTDIPLSITMAVSDPDGSETITLVRISGVPTGGTLNWTNFAGATVTKPSAGVYEIAGAEAAIRNVLGTATVRPPLHSDAEFDLSVTVRATETNPTTSGEVALLNRDTTFTLPVNVTAVADQPTVPNNTTNGTEDTTITFGPNVAYALVDADGSEAVTSVAVSGVPSGWTLAYTATGGGSVALAGGVLHDHGHAGGHPRHGWTHSASRRLRTTTPTRCSPSPSPRRTRAASRPSAMRRIRGRGRRRRHARDQRGRGVVHGQRGHAGRPHRLLRGDRGHGRIGGQGGLEVLHVVRIVNVPTGASFQDGSGNPVGTNAGGNVWTFTAGELATLRFLPPANLSARST